MLHNNSYSNCYYFSLQLGRFLIHHLNGLSILLSNNLALHLQSRSEGVSEGTKVLGQDCIVLGRQRRERARATGELSSTIMNHKSKQDQTLVSR